jgi:predicted Zn-dependent protease
LDYDDEDSFMLGRSIDGTNIAYIFMETIRDRAGVAGAVDEPRLKKRVTLHESGHLMGLKHTPDISVMNINTNLTGTDDENRFVNWQLGRIQAQPEPYWAG